MRPKHKEDETVDAKRHKTPGKREEKGPKSKRHRSRRPQAQESAKKEKKDIQTRDIMPVGVKVRRL